MCVCVCEYMCVSVRGGVGVVCSTSHCYSPGMLDGSSSMFYDGNRSSLALGGTACNLLSRRVGRESPDESDRTDGGLAAVTKLRLVQFCRPSSTYSQAFFHLSSSFPVWKNQPLNPFQPVYPGDPFCYFD